MVPPNSEGRRRFGDRMRFLRLERKLSQKALAKSSGLNQNYLSDVERGRRNVGLDNILKIADGLEVTPDQLFRDDRLD